MTTYLIHQKITLFQNKYFLYKTTGKSNKLVAFAEQKRFAFKEKFTFYSDDSRKKIVFELQARSALDFGARYDITDASGKKLGTVGKAFKSSLLRSTWQVFNSDETEASITAQERSLPIAVFRRLWELIPLLPDYIPFFVKYHFDFYRDIEKDVVATYEKTTTVRDNYELKILDDSILDEHDWRVIVALGVMMDALQSR